MLKLKSILLAVAALALTACGGGSDNTLVNPGGPGGGGANTEVATLELLTSAAQIPSDGSQNATITAIVKNSSNNVLENVTVLFASDSGSISVSQPAVTDPNGQLTASLSTLGNPTTRTITVTATAGDVSATIGVNVIGTQLDLNGPASLATNDVGTYNITVVDAGGNGVSGVSVDITSDTGNTISQTPVVTNGSGAATFTLTALVSGLDTLTASTATLNDTHQVNVTGDAFSITTPAANTEIALNTATPVTANWAQNGGAVVGGTVSFSTTRGVITPTSIATDGSGNATVSIQSANAGLAVITATNADGTSTQRQIEFVASTPASLDLQAKPFTIGTQEQSAITAVVRDASGNLVKNQTVDFTLDDVTGGTLSVGTAVTDSQGRAQTTYTASSSTSAADGVTITATVRSTAVMDSVDLTVSQRELFLSIGTGNEIFEPNSAQYRIEYAVQVTDSQGNGVDGADVQVNIRSIDYRKGFRVQVVDGWTTQIEAMCPDEDVNRNGQLDMGEDLNTSGQIEAGNIATVSAQSTGTGSFSSDVNGFGFIDVVYPQEFAYYALVELEATTGVVGTEFSQTTRFVLPGAASDFNNVANAPPGVVSPFGQSANCGDTL